MNSIERLTACVNFNNTDRIPVIPQVFGHAARLASVELSNYLRDGQLLADCQMKAYKCYNYDAVFAFMDVNVETEAVGSEIKFRSNNYPVISSYIGDKMRIQDFQVPDPYRSARMPEILKASSILREKVGNEGLVTGCVMGPMTLAIQLIGIQKALYLSVDDHQSFEKLLDFCVETAITYGKAQIKSGVHLPLIFEPAGTQEIIPPGFYREFIMDRIKKIFMEFKSAGSIINWLHTAGSISNILKYYPDMGVELANIDYAVNPSLAKKILPNTAFNGNIKIISFLETGPEQVLLESKNILDIFANRGGFVLSSGCEIPIEAKSDNITAMVNLAKKYSCPK